MIVLMKKIKHNGGMKGDYKAMLIMKYERKDFFGNRQYTEDRKENYNREDVKKAFLHLSKDRFSSVQKKYGLLLGEHGGF